MVAGISSGSSATLTIERTRTYSVTTAPSHHGGRARGEKTGCVQVRLPDRYITANATLHPVSTVPGGGPSLGRRSGDAAGLKP